MDALIIEALPAVINTNYEVVRAQLEADLEKYNVVVTADTLKESKALATKLNKVKIEIAIRRKEEIAKVSGPLKEFEAQVKTLESMCEDGRQGILEQVRAFESIRLEHIQRDLDALLQETCKVQGLEKEFQTASIDDLVKLGAFTAGGHLTKGAKDAVLAKVGECLLRQSRTSLRISELENESHRCGLHSPLTREHIAGFLFEDNDEDYKHNLAALIARELERQTETIAKAEEQAARDKAAGELLAEAAQKKQDELDKLAELDVGRTEIEADRAPLTRQSQIDEQIRPSPGEPEPFPADPFPVEQEWPQNGQAHIDQEEANIRARMAGEAYPPPAPAETTSTREVQVSIRLSIDAPHHITLEQIETALRGKLAQAGVEKSLKQIIVIEKP